MKILLKRKDGDKNQKAFRANEPCSHLSMNGYILNIPKHILMHKTEMINPKKLIDQSSIIQ